MQICVTERNTKNVLEMRWRDTAASHNLNNSTAKQSKTNDSTTPKRRKKGKKKGRNLYRSSITQATNKAMTYCDNCHRHLGSNEELIRHLDQFHNIHVRLGQDSGCLAYCNECHKYLGKKKHNGKLALEKHLEKYHDIHLHEGCMD
eukprot:CAMPEP_0113512364 /NCGR_PEP_ID=MMETSP0014_2-20120614/39302_1 /TAXON_ID=2857 /ORGANISM="Nitzschia sp." /LENGTH=145 /DNA_ID=CAMNT_0000408721 /DNA_START=65 /DNA_END=502 /DNA_ORIENTATION=- /assembly_acc=CAM_ASM_000159